MSSAPPPARRRAGGAGRRWKGSNFSSKWDRSDRIRFPGQHSTFHPSPAFASQRQQPGKPAGSRTTTPNSQTHTHRHKTRALKGFATCSPGVHIARSFKAAKTSDPTPTICRWCQRFQFPIRFEFMVIRYFAPPMQLLPDFTNERFYTLPAVSL